ncbi:hypothetical protein E2C01_044261 [Portunus trituberculatus]|uniref:Uncharacterized protein n=1 Tax=Portunus trituberculatus TaxID=210409 RepID=A0A5B7FV58_PORTR|nr:hypothetical protein [Portunus trituberculatus]
MGRRADRPEGAAWRLDGVTKIAEQYAASGITSPANCVWMHLFSMGQHDQANEVYQKHLKTSTSLLMFRNIMKCAEKAGDTGLLASLTQVLESHPGLSNQAKGLVYNSWIGILCKCHPFLFFFLSEMFFNNRCQK